MSVKDGKVSKRAESKEITYKKLSTARSSVQQIIKYGTELWLAMN